MESNQDKWIDDVLNSMEGSQRARPDNDLYSRIEAQISEEETPVIPLRRFRIAAAAAVVLILFNVFSIRYYFQDSNSGDSSVITVADPTSTEQSLVSDYKLYDL